MNSVEFGDTFGLPICPMCGETVDVCIEQCGFNNAVYVASCGCVEAEDYTYTEALNEWKRKTKYKD